MANPRDKIFVTSIDFNNEIKARISFERINLPDESKKIIFMSGSISQDTAADSQERNALLLKIAAECSQRSQKQNKDIEAIYYDDYLAVDYNIESALPLIYAQMHKIAAENPEAEITFCYNGTLAKDDMSFLVGFFEVNTQMIPANMKLNFKYYSQGKNPGIFQTTKGTGLIDYNYHQNIGVMVKHAGQAAKPIPEKKINKISDPILRVFFYNDIAELFLHNREILPEQPLAKLDALIKQTRTYATVFENSDDNNTENNDTNEVNLQEKFHENLVKLHTALSADIQAQKAKNIPDAKIQTSSAMRVAKETCTLLVNLSQPETSKEDKIKHIHQFELNCKKTARWSNFWKSIAVIALIALGIVIGAVAGAGIGIAAGAWSGPGAVATGFVGLFTGAATGASIGLTFGAAATGMVTGAISAGLLFRDTPVTAAVTLTSEYGVRALGAKSNFAD